MSNPLHVNLTELAGFGQLNLREQQIVKVAAGQAARQGYEHRSREVAEVLNAVKDYVADTETAATQVQKVMAGKIAEVIKTLTVAHRRDMAAARSGLPQSAQPAALVGPDGEPVAEVIYRIPMPKGADFKFEGPDPSMFTGKGSGVPPVLRLEMPEGINVNMHEDKKPDMMIEYSPDGRQTRIRR